MKKILLINLIIIFLAGVFMPFLASAQEKADLTLFYSPTCPHCAKEKEFLNELQTRYPEVEIEEYSITKKENIPLLKKFYDEFEVPKQRQGLVPATFTRERFFLGFNKQIGKNIEQCLKKCLAGEEGALEEKINLPWVGPVDPADYSLPALAVVLGALDGFNVCSLGALVLILSLVLSLGSRKKILFFGGLFLIITALVYGALIIFWYQIFHILAPYLRWLEIVIGFLALAGGFYFLKEFFRFRKEGPGCKMGLAQKLMAKFSKIFKAKLKKSSNWLLLAGAILLFAAILTVVEFPCSAAAPLAFAGVLAKSGLSQTHYLFLIGLFVLFYLFDEILVFVGSFLTMKVWLAGSTKIAIWVALAQGLILSLLGFYYLL